jgi:uncharacterized protein
VARSGSRFSAFFLLLFCLPNPQFAQNVGNSLADSKSEFLHRASTQPVAWVPLSRALTTAREMRKPLLVEVGAIWCPFCRAMDDDTYSNPKIALFLNEHYVAARIDYDTQPELAHKLELARARAKLPSGMPLTMLVTPEGKLFDGGGYFPPSPAKYKPSFSEFLKRGVAEFSDKHFPIEPFDIASELQQNK